MAYAAATFDCKADFPLELFDALVIHFSVRMPFETMSPSFVELVSRFSGPKVLLIQDEYDMPRKACALIRKLGVDTIFTTVPKPFVEKFYPSAELPNVKFRSCLTGYVPDELPFELARRWRNDASGSLTVEESCRSGTGNWDSKNPPSRSG
ncbi:hypothetical protein [Bradyrhizobium sp. 2S1]|uniref:hypothetical protein n=1 Tax=Bradyrhizobium sp. 2S1 TaxID=1404429 RepID=UPI00140D8064|nr:hypothetical protein [Bradyrhizobium sp. 2S1]MCK7665570.1 hypothetical protein [Bradyrhizobium sp. 2S1]